MSLPGPPGGPRRRPRLPSLRALLALEAAVGRGSATAAAEELGVTHGAVSKQLAQLQAALGRPLFLRGRAQLTPTAEAAALAQVIGQSLDRIAEAVEALRGTPPGREVRVVAPADFAMRWLIPRLHGLQAHGPNLAAVVRTTDRDDDWRSLVFDVAIRRGEAAPPGFTRQPFLRESITLLAGGPAAAAPAPDALSRWRFCEAATRPGELDAWLRLAGLDPAACRDRQVFPRFYLAAEAALAGAGALVGPVQILAEEVREGRLHAPFPALVLPGADLVCLFDPAGPRAAAARAFVDWLAGAAAVPPG
jgi:DNA-binding transcriptional LysR family regulator